MPAPVEIVSPLPLPVSEQGLPMPVSVQNFPAMGIDLLHEQRTSGSVFAVLSTAHLYKALLVVATAGANYRIVGPGLRVESGTNFQFLYPVVESGAFEPGTAVEWKIFRVMTHNATPSASEPISLDGFIPFNEFGHHGIRVYGLPRG